MKREDAEYIDSVRDRLVQVRERGQTYESIADDLDFGSSVRGFATSNAQMSLSRVKKLDAYLLTLEKALEQRDTAQGRAASDSIDPGDSIAENLMSLARIAKTKSLSRDDRAKFLRAQMPALSILIEALAEKKS
jgi:hypothetical protein